MCGIVGFLDYTKVLDLSNLNQMLLSIQHRGPDGYDQEIWNTDKYTLGFGHRRLSIIDLSELGKQPMSKHGLHITYNGEIYNYKEVKEELVELGYSFKSDSDTEVILSGFDCWGVKVVDKLIGMFAIALYNEKDKDFFLIRDRAGVKPLYYYVDGSNLLFASELKAFHEIPFFKKQINIDSLAEYFQYGFISTPNCIFTNCHKLEQGHYLKIDLESKKHTKTSYWNVFNHLGKNDLIKGLDENDILLKTEELLTSASNYRMVSDVPVGIFLSGGYDSSLVTALVQKESTEKVKTFTIGFEEDQYNEAKEAKQVAHHLGTDHSEMVCSVNDAKEIIPMVSDICDEPFGDSSIIPTYLVSKMARKNVTVALSSDGGDEQFIGYKRYVKALKLGNLINKSPGFLNKMMGSVGPMIFKGDRIKEKVFQALKNNNVSSIPSIQIQNLFSREVRSLIKAKCSFDNLSHIPSSDDINSIFAAEYLHYMQDDIMVKVDRAAMAVSLEGREPLLDHRVIEWALNIPFDLKYKNNTLKYLLKEITHKYIPKEMMDRPKHGFGVPVLSWLRGDMSYLINDYLNKERIQVQGLFDANFVENHVNQFKLNNPESSTFVWHMLVFQMWYDRWM